jgi:hypothetical protein
VNRTIVFEDSYANWKARGSALINNTLSYDPTKLALLLYAMPSLSKSATEALLQTLLSVGHGVFLTGSANYTGFDSYWPVFVDCMDGLLS